MAVSERKAEYNFSSTMSRGSGEDYAIFCQPCDRDDLRLPAFGFCTDCEEHLCESCFNHHKRAKPSRHHILLDKHNMPQTLKFPTKSTHVGQSDDLTKPCPTHIKEIIKYYCNDHKALLCSVCVTLDHPRTSCLVNYIPDISKNSLNSKELRETLEDLDIITEKYKKTTALLKEKVTSSNKSLMDVLADIKKFRQEINQRLDELEKEAEDKAKALQQEHFTTLKTAESTCDEVTKSMKVSSDTLKQLNNSKQADRLFMELKTAVMLIKDNEKKLSQQQSSNNVKDYTFQPNPEIVSTLQREKTLGALEIKSTKSSSLTSADVRLPHFAHQQDICVKTSKDKSTCNISGMVLLTPSNLILTDYDNTSVKMVDLNNNTITDQLELDDNPCDITSVTSDQVAITLPVRKTVQFISASSNKLLLKYKLKVDGRCYGISCYQNKLVVTYGIEAKLQILDLEGKVLTTVTKDSMGKVIFCTPINVRSNSQSIYVSDGGEHAVIMFNWQGELTGRYGSIGDAAGIALLEDGFISLSERDKGNIHHISGDLTRGNVVLKNLKNPNAVCWCGTNSKLYISRHKLFCDEKFFNVIQVFKNP